MSLNNANIANENDNNSSWATCPGDILLMVLKKLDIESVINCIDVNIFWRNIVEYYCEHANLWKAMVQHSIDDVLFSEKSTLEGRDKFLTAHQWLNIRDVNVSLRYQYQSDAIRNICIFQGKGYTFRMIPQKSHYLMTIFGDIRQNAIIHRSNLIVVTNEAVKYFNIENFKNTKIIERSYLKFEENATMIVELTVALSGITGSNVLTLSNKLFTANFDPESEKVSLSNIRFFKVHLNSCYVVDFMNVLWMYTATGTRWKCKSLAKYYGNNKNPICNIHIYKSKVYVFLERGDVLYVDMECMKFQKIHHFNEDFLYAKPLMFRTCNLLIEAQNFKSEYKEDCIYGLYNFIFLSGHGVTSFLKHGHALILGYKDGKIQIYLIRKLTASSKLPEIEFNIQNYCDKISSPEIRSLDVYEDHIGHHLFVWTDSDVYELLLCTKNSYHL